MDRLSAAIERFEAAADRLERSGVKAMKRAEAQADGARAQGVIIEQLRHEINALTEPHPERPEAASANETGGAAAIAAPADEPPAPAPALVPNDASGAPTRQEES